MTAKKTAEGGAPQPTFRATAILTVGIGATHLAAQGNTSSQLANFYSIGVGISLIVGFLADYRGNIRNLVRADVMWDPLESTCRHASLSIL